MKRINEIKLERLVRLHSPALRSGLSRLTNSAPQLYSISSDKITKLHISLNMAQAKPHDIRGGGLLCLKIHNKSSRHTG